MSERLIVPLGEVIGIKHGFAFSGDGFVEDHALPTLVTPGNFALGGGFRAAKQKNFLGEIPSEYVLAPGDLIVSMTDLSKAGDTLGLPALVPDDGTYLHNQRIGLVKLIKPRLVDLNFLHYYLRTREYRAHILGSATGSTVRHTSPSRISSFLANLPCLPQQTAIAELLGALDDKIAANNRIASTAGRLADLLFAVASQPLPFSDLTFDELATISGGGTPSTKDESYWGGEIQWATPTDVTGLHAPYLESTSRRITTDGLRACSSALHPVGSILMTSRATIGAFAVTQQPTAVNQGFIVVNANEPILQWWLFHEMRSRVPEFLSHANGATFLELSRGRFRNLAVRVADQQVMREFSTRVDMLHKRAHAAMVETSHLSATRDALLPLLMSGKLRVKDAEQQIAGVV